MDWIRYPIRFRNKNWIKLGLIDLSKLVPQPCSILCLVIFDNWKTWLELVMLENLQACFFCFVQNLFGLRPSYCVLTMQSYYPHRENLLLLCSVILTFLKKNGWILMKNPENQHWYLNLKSSLCKWKTKDSKRNIS